MLRASSEHPSGAQFESSRPLSNIKTMAAITDWTLDNAVNNITSFPVKQSWNNATDQPKAASTPSSPLDSSAGPPSGRISDISASIVPSPAGQHIPKKHLTRPQSSGDSIAAGLMFGKAEPAVLNMSRQLGQASRALTTILVVEASSPGAMPNVETTLNNSSIEMDYSNTKTTTIETPYHSPVKGFDKTALASQYSGHQAQSAE